MKAVRGGGEGEREVVYGEEDTEKGPGILVDLRSFGLQGSWKS